MLGVFTLTSEFDLDNNTDEYHPTQGCHPVNLLHHFQDTSLENIQRVSIWFMRFRDETDVQDLLWSGTKILNSCD